MNQTSQHIADMLKEAHLRPSLQRIAILEYLNTHFTHPTVDEIYAALAPTMPTLSKTTVYNTLRSLTDAGLALALTLDDKNTHYDGTLHPHAHGICCACGQIKDIFLHNENTFTLPQVHGMQLHRAEISYFGLCDTCRQKGKSTEQQTLKHTTN